MFVKSPSEGCKHIPPGHPTTNWGAHLNRIIGSRNHRIVKLEKTSKISDSTIDELYQTYTSFFIGKTHFHNLCFSPHIFLPLAGTMPCCETSTSGWLYPAMKYPLHGTGPKQKGLLKTWYPCSSFLSGTDISHQQTHCGEHHHRSLTVHLLPLPWMSQSPFFCVTTKYLKRLPRKHNIWIQFPPQAESL